jgi:hypothetical protein
VRESLIAFDRPKIVVESIHATSHGRATSSRLPAPSSQSGPLVNGANEPTDEGAVGLGGTSDL